MLTLVGMACAVQLVPQVTELVISELLWLNYSNPEKPVYLYIHSMGSQTPDGQVQVAFCTRHRLRCSARWSPRRLHSAHGWKASALGSTYRASVFCRLRPAIHDPQP